MVCGVVWRGVGGSKKQGQGSMNELGADPNPSTEARHLLIDRNQDWGSWGGWKKGTVAHPKNYGVSSLPEWGKTGAAGRLSEKKKKKENKKNKETLRLEFGERRCGRGPRKGLPSVPWESFISRAVLRLIKWWRVGGGVARFSSYNHPPSP